MKRWLVLAAAALFLLSVAPVQADVTVTADIIKTKTKTVTEEVIITKNVDVRVFGDLLADKAAEAEALINQTNEWNHACENCAEKRTTITGSVLNNTGVVTVNQAVGNMNNQGIALSVAVDTGEGLRNGFAGAQAAADQYSKGNTINSIFILFRDSLITSSVNDNVGIIGVNQSAGNMNNQADAVALGVALGEGFAISEADLGQVNIGNDVFESVVWKTAITEFSVLSNKGIVSVNQASGNMGNQAHVVSVGIAWVNAGVFLQ